MFSKTLFFAVLFCAVVFANAESQSEHGLRIKRQVGEKVTAFAAEQAKQLAEFFGNAKNVVSSFWKRMIGKENEENQAEIEALKAKLEQQRKDSVKDLTETNEKYLAEVKRLTAKIDELSGKNPDELKTAAQDLKDTKEKAESDVKQKIRFYQNLIDETAAELNKALKLKQ